MLKKKGLHQKKKILKKKAKFQNKTPDPFMQNLYKEMSVNLAPIKGSQSL